MRIATQQMFHDRAHLSHIILPVIPNSSEPVN